jgi:hypothetical protein
MGALDHPLVGWLEAEMGHRGDGWGAQQRVGEVEQRIGATGAAGVQLGPEVTERARGKVGVGMAAQPDPLVGDRQPN